ncbi:hypothetical protein OKJ48_29440 [Streptomyces kunmingensis]|uniref:Uncharacterized protein n=1 Tax=Streptomyces kunmingensis TaxID=68225 RepID=A0ABU6CJC0_9ACTN|nr:hypothetical protein [Streptomyces kunmingensis]MEB3964326.1 hypothetical protein [Streptomyces kunmingensis]
MVTLSVTLILIIIAIMLLRRPVAARGRGDTALVMALVLILGVLIAPTSFGQAITSGVNQLATSISSWGG